MTTTAWRGRVRHQGKTYPALRRGERVWLGRAGDVLFGDGFDKTRFDVEVALDDVDVLCPVGAEHRPQIVCVGRNYAAHAKELGNAVPDEPKLFLKPHTTLIGPGDAIVRPVHMSNLVHHEGEFAVVVGKPFVDVTRDNALDFIAGFTLANDVTARDVQRKDSAFSRGKGFATFCPLGPWVVPLEEDNAWLSGPVIVNVNGKERQRGCASDMVFDVVTLVAFIAQVFALQPGDIILTGTPEGVGPLVAGDEVVVDCGLLQLQNPVVNGPSTPSWRPADTH